MSLRGRGWERHTHRDTHRERGRGMKVGQCAASEGKCDLKPDEEECITCQEVRVRLEMCGP